MATHRERTRTAHLERRSGRKESGGGEPTITSSTENGCEQRLWREGLRTLTYNRPIASYLVVPYFAVLYKPRRRKGEKAFVYPNDEFAPLNAYSEAVTMIVAAAASAAANGHQKPEQDQQRGVGTYGRPDGDRGDRKGFYHTADEGGGGRITLCQVRAIDDDDDRSQC